MRKILTFKQYRLHHIEEFEEWLITQKLATQEIQQKREQIESWIKEEYKKEVEAEEALTFKLPEEKRASLKKDAEVQSKLGLQVTFDRLMNCHSFYNEVPTKIMFHVLLGTLLKNKETKISEYKSVKPIMHELFVQSSGSGKDEAVDFIIKVIKEFNYKMATSQKGDRIIKVFEMMGAESMEVLVNHYEKKNAHKYDYTKIVKGLFERYDLIVSRECSFLFREKGGEKQMKSELMLSGLEGKSFEKALVSFEGRVPTTTPNFCFIGLTRPFAGFQNYVANSGLIQRSMTYFRIVTSDLRTKMNERSSMSNMGSLMSDDEYKKLMAKLVIGLEDIQTFYFNTSIKPDNPELLDKIINDNKNEMSKDCLNNIIRWEIRDIIESFISRYNNHIRVLAIHNAVLDKSSVIKEVHVQEACNLARESYEAIKVFIQHNVQETSIMESKRKAITGLLNNFFKTTPTVKRKDLVEYVSIKLGIDKKYAYALIGLCSEGERAIITEDFEGKIILKQRMGAT